MRYYKNILTGLFLISSTILFAQNNIVKTGFSDALFGNFNLSYERMVGQNSSFLLKAGYMEPTVSPFISEKTITPRAYTFEKSNGGLNASMEYRMFITKNEALRGFYISPYLRYLDQSLAFFDEIDNRNFHVDTHLNIFGIGAQLGYQLIINDIFAVDFYLIGTGLDYYTIDLKYRLTQTEAGFDYGSITNDIKDVFKNMDYLEKKLNLTVNEDNLITKLPFIFPGLKMGISAGIAF